MHSLLILAVLSSCVFRPDAAVPEPRGHTRSTPRIGGISIFIAYLVSFAILLLSPFQFGNIVRSHLDVVRNLFPAATIVFFTGLLYDLLGLKAWQKFAAQFAASA
jgi:UDP-N-acetylmuramyl pentapeptide phosphotransferase/UDP-N-acetylglucosamine-1-phosphate transferase